MIFERNAQHQRRGGRRGVEFLKKPTSEESVVNDGPADGHAELRLGVNTPAPDAAAQHAKIFRMLTRQQRLRLAVAGLLIEVGRDGGTAVVANQSRRAEPNPVSRLW